MLEMSAAWRDAAAQAAERISRRLLTISDQNTGREGSGDGWFGRILGIVRVWARRTERCWARLGCHFSAKGRRDWRFDRDFPGLVDLFFEFKLFAA